MLLYLNMIFFFVLDSHNDMFLCRARHKKTQFSNLGFFSEGLTNNSSLTSQSIKINFKDIYDFTNTAKDGKIKAQFILTQYLNELAQQERIDC